MVRIQQVVNADGYRPPVAPELVLAAQIEAVLSDSPEVEAQDVQRLRPGMEGAGKINVERRRLIWIWTHDLMDRLRLWLWRWMP